MTSWGSLTSEGGSALSHHVIASCSPSSSTFSCHSNPLLYSRTTDQQQQSTRLAGSQFEQLAIVDSCAEHYLQQQQSQNACSPPAADGVGAPSSVVRISKNGKVIGSLKISSFSPSNSLQGNRTGSGEFLQTQRLEGSAVAQLEDVDTPEQHINCQLTLETTEAQGVSTGPATKLPYTLKSLSRPPVAPACWGHTGEARALSRSHALAAAEEVVVVEAASAIASATATTRQKFSEDVQAVSGSSDAAHNSSSNSRHRRKLSGQALLSEESSTCFPLISSDAVIARAATSTDSSPTAQVPNRVINKAHPSQHSEHRGVTVNRVGDCSRNSGCGGSHPPLEEDPTSPIHYSTRRQQQKLQRPQVDNRESFLLHSTVTPTAAPILAVSQLQQQQQKIQRQHQYQPKLLPLGTTTITSVTTTTASSTTTVAVAGSTIKSSGSPIVPPLRAFSDLIPASTSGSHSSESFAFYVTPTTYVSSCPSTPCSPISCNPSALQTTTCFSLLATTPSTTTMNTVTSFRSSLTTSVSSTSNNKSCKNRNMERQHTSNKQGLSAERKRRPPTGKSFLSSAHETAAADSMSVRRAVSVPLNAVATTIRSNCANNGSNTIKNNHNNNNNNNDNNNELHGNLLVTAFNEREREQWDSVEYPPAGIAAAVPPPLDTTSCLSNLGSNIFKATSKNRKNIQPIQGFRSDRVGPSAMGMVGTVVSVNKGGQFI